MLKKIICVLTALTLTLGCASFAAGSLPVTVTGLTAENGAVVSASVYAENAAADCAAIAAVFDGGEFVGAEISENIMPAGQEGEFIFDFPSDLPAAEGQTVKVMVWEYDGGLTARPAAASRSFTVGEETAGPDEPQPPAQQSENLAEFVFASLTETNADLSEEWGNKTDGYIPVKGVLADSARLFASVNGTDARKLEWSADLYSSGEAENYAAVMTAGSKNPWGEAPYIEAQLSSAGYGSITVSAKLGGTKKGPKNFALCYSLDGVNFTDVAAYSVSTNKTLEQAFYNVALPEEAGNCEALYIRLRAVGEETIGGALLSENSTGGETAVSDFIIGVGSAEVTYKPEISEPEPVPEPEPEAPTGDGIIHLLGAEIDAEGVENVTVEGSAVTISAAGDYIIEGALDDGQIIVSTADKSENVNITLSGVSVSSSVGSPFCAAEGKVTLVLAEGTENFFADPEAYTDTTGNAALYSRRDLTIRGGGALTVKGNFNNAIGTKADLEILGGTIYAEGVNNGLKGNDSVTIDTAASVTVVSGGDGIKSDNIEEADKGFVEIKNGTVNVTAAEDGIQADLLAAVRGGSLIVNSGTEGIKANASSADETAPAIADGRVEISGGYIEITSGEDAVKSTASTVTVSGGEIKINSKQDGFQAETTLDISGGNFDIYCYKDGYNSDADSCKGLKGVGGVNISGGVFALETLDDCVHSDGCVTVSGGTLALYSGDDGIHADETLTISGGAHINISDSYEGLEGLTVNILGGEVRLKASDDGINAAGGNDGSGWEDRTPTFPGGGSGSGGWGGGVRPWSVEAMDSSGLINIEGGYIYVDAQGDGIDSNGSITMSGGTVLVCGPTGSGNGALDFDAGFTQSGGLLAAAGAQGMVQYPSGSQYCVNITYRSAQSAGTIVSIRSGGGGDILTFAPSKQYQSLVVSSPAFVKGETYSLYGGGSCAGENVDGLYFGGEYSGTLKTAFTVNNTVTSVSVN